MLGFLASAFFVVLVNVLSEILAYALLRLAGYEASYPVIRLLSAFVTAGILVILVGLSGVNREEE